MGCAEPLTPDEERELREALEQARGAFASLLSERDGYRREALAWREWNMKRSIKADTHVAWYELKAARAANEEAERRDISATPDVSGRVTTTAPSPSGGHAPNVEPEGRSE